MRVWALIVAIDQYHQLTGQPPLQGAVADATDFAEWALDPAGGNVPPGHLFFWTYPAPVNPGPLLQAYLALPAAQRPEWHNVDTDWAPPDLSRAPRAVEIVETAQRVGRDLRSAAFAAGDSTDRRIIIFMAGHGLRAKEVGNPSEQTCFVADDFRRTTSSNVQGLVPCESFRKALLTDRFTQALVFLDCCRLQTSRLQNTATPITDFVKEPLGVSWGVGNAAQDGQVAYETATVPVRGAFTRTLMDGLRTYRQGGVLHMAHLKQFVGRNITAHTTRGQVPDLFYGPNDELGMLVVSGPPTGVPTFVPGPLVDATGLAAGTALVLSDGFFNVVPVAPPLVAGPAPVALPPLPDGLYMIATATGQTAIFKHPGSGTIIV